MPSDWWKKHEDKQSDLEEARYNESVAASWKPPQAAKVVPNRDRRTATVDSGHNGTVKHKGF